MSRARTAVIDMDTLVQICGHFDSRSPVNNGYGCRHPEQEDQVDVDGVKHGRCFSFSCPLASELNKDEPLDRPLYEKAGLVPEDCGEGDWVCVDAALLEDT